MPHNQDNAASLWRRLTERNDPRARAALIDANRPLVTATIRRLTRRPPPGLSWEDLDQAGMMGLTRAVDRFDPARGVQFGTFATPWIAGAARRLIQRALRHSAPECGEPSESLVGGAAADAPVLERARAELLWGAVDQLGPDLAHVLTRHYRDGLTLADIARERGWHQSLAYRLHRAGLLALRGVLPGDEFPRGR